MSIPPLAHALIANKFNIVEVLLNHNASIDIIIGGHNLIHHLVQSSPTAINTLIYILKEHANKFSSLMETLNIKTQHGNPPLELLAYKKDIRDIDKLTAIKLMIQNGAELSYDFRGIK